MMLEFPEDGPRVVQGVDSVEQIGKLTHDLDARRALLVTDRHIVNAGHVDRAVASLEAAHIAVAVFDEVHENPTTEDVDACLKLAQSAEVDVIIGFGGGSSLDTAKGCNFILTNGGKMADYRGTGKAKHAMLPLIAVPTTAGTGSETTGVAIFDLLEMHAKTGIAHRALRPVMGIIDPHNTRTLPKMAAACSGLDVLSHALESLTALPYTQRPAAEHPKLRPAYQGANPISHLWASRAIEMVAQNIVRAIDDPEDDEARGEMLLAAALAGIGFGNAGVHLPHGMSYPVSGMVRDYRPPGYNVDHAMIPHGMSVILNAPAVFRFTAPTNPELHLYAARLMGADTSGAAPDDAGEVLADAIIDMMRKTGMPNGLQAVGFTEADVDQLVEGTLPQHRVTKLSPRPAERADLRRLFLDSMVCW